MKILAQLSENIAGFRKPCEDLGHQWIWWEDGVPAFDAFDINKPDIAFLDHSSLDGPTVKRVAEYDGKLPMVIAQEVGIELLFHYNTIALPKAFNGVAVPAAVDTDTFYDTPRQKDMECQLALVSEEQETPNEVKKLLFPIGKYKIRLYGPRWRNHVQYVGNIGIEQMRQVYSSSHMVYVNTAKEALRVVECGGFAVSLNPDLEHLGDGFRVTEERLRELLECETNDLEMIQLQQTASKKLSYYKVLEQLKEKGLEL